VELSLSRRMIWQNFIIFSTPNKNLGKLFSSNFPSLVVTMSQLKGVQISFNENYEKQTFEKDKDAEKSKK
jgi:hypothetical protein